MRLINAETLKIEVFYPPNIPPYAILSHRWGDDEITFDDYVSGTSTHKSAYEKITHMAEITKATKKPQRLNYFWIDTCCINKADYSELSESINSMYRWYRDSTVCIAYLPDVPHGSPDMLTQSEWFRRGWTLQELVAPRRLYFYDDAWKCIGNKMDMVEAIFKLTNVPRRVLANQAEPSVYSVARRMSWAANRKTTRFEDMAYCLLGIFDVNMPLLYGEGAHSFRRLQEEIIKRSNDLTILAWCTPDARDPLSPVQHSGSAGKADHDHTAHTEKMPPTTAVAPADKEKQLMAFPSSPGHKTPRAVSPASSPPAYSSHSSPVSQKRGVFSSQHLTPPRVPGLAVSGGSSFGSGDLSKRAEMCLFAASPNQFSRYASLHPFADDFENYAVTNRGLFMSGSVYLRLVLRPVSHPDEPIVNQYLLLLGSQFSSYIGIYLIKVGPNLFQRSSGEEIAVLDYEKVQQMRGFLVTDWYISIEQRPGSITPQTYRQHAIHVPSQGYCNKFVMIRDTSPTHLWDVQDRLFVRPKAYGWTRYDMVLAMKFAVALKDTSGAGAGAASKRVSFVVLCNYRMLQEEPKFMVFLEDDFPKETEMLLARRGPNSSLMWADLDVICPQLSKLSDTVLADVGTRPKSCWYRIWVKATKGRVQLEYSSPELYSVCFDIKQVEHVPRDVHK